MNCLAYILKTIRSRVHYFFSETPIYNLFAQTMSKLALGQLVLVIYKMDNLTGIDVSCLKRGIYFLKILFNERIFNSQFVKK